MTSLLIAREVERGAFKDANALVSAALLLLEREQEDDEWKMFALKRAIAEGDASGIAEGNVFQQIFDEIDSGEIDRAESNAR